MRIQIVSDLHCEFYRDDGRALLDSLATPNVDVLVCAGDLHLGERIVPALERLADLYPHVVYLAGNHEFYRGDALKMDKFLKNLRLPGVHVLNPGEVTLGGVRFVGATLWFGPVTDARTEAARQGLNDYHFITNFEPWVYDRHAADRKFLSDRMASADVVITHHLPAKECVAPQFADSDLNHFFHAKADDLVQRCKAKLWVHGHTHTSVDVKVGGVRVLANPKGYPHERVGFDPHLVVTV